MIIIGSLWCLAYATLREGLDINCDKDVVQYFQKVFKICESLNTETEWLTLAVVKTGELAVSQGVAGGADGGDQIDGASTHSDCLICLCFIGDTPWPPVVWFLCFLKI